MKTKLFVVLTLAATVFAGNIFAAPRSKMPKSRITMEQAQEIALRRVSGEVEKSDTIKRRKKEFYSFFIKESNGVTAHVLVNDRGKIKRVTDETPARARIK